MRGSIRQVGAERVELRLRSFATRIPDTARGQMRRSSAAIVKLAKILVPEDTGALMDSIRVEKVYDERGRLAISIIAGGQGYATEKGIPLDQYAGIIHELYDDMQPGEKTVEKQLRYPTHKIGSRFLTRAFENQEEALMRSLVVAITDLTRSF